MYIYIFIFTHTHTHTHTHTQVRTLPLPLQDLSWARLDAPLTLALDLSAAQPAGAAVLACGASGLGSILGAHVATWHASFPNAVYTVGDVIPVRVTLRSTLIAAVVFSGDVP